MEGILSRKGVDQKPNLPSARQAVSPGSGLHLPSGMDTCFKFTCRLHLLAKGQCPTREAAFMQIRQRCVLGNMLGVTEPHHRSHVHRGWHDNGLQMCPHLNPWDLGMALTEGTLQMWSGARISRKEYYPGLPGGPN